MVEDSRLDEELIRRALRRGGLVYELKRVDTRAGFVQQLAKSPPDVILSDFAMPAFGGMEALALAPGEPERLWAAAAARIFESADRGMSWHPVGQPLPEAPTPVYGLAVAEAGTIMVLTTPRGLWRSADGGASWRLMEGNLPVHLEAGPLVRDPTDPATLYAGFSLLPYRELWDLALQGRTLLQRVKPLSLAGGVAFLMALALLGGLAVHRLAQARRTPRPVQSWGKGLRR